MATIRYLRIHHLVGIFSGHSRMLVRNMALIVAFVFAAKLAGLGKEILVAARLGTGASLDAFLFFFSILSMPIAVWYSVASVVVIPLVSKLRLQGEELEHQFNQEFIGRSLLLSICLGVLIWLSLRASLEVTSFGLALNGLELAKSTLDILAIIVPLGILAHTGSVILMAHGFHANTLLEGVPAVSVLILMVIMKDQAFSALLIGTALGFSAQLILTLLVLKKHDLLVSPRFSGQSKAWPDFKGAVSSMLAAQVLLALTTVVDQLYAAAMGEGAISSMGYAVRVIGLFLSLGATAIGRATLPIYSHVRNREPEALFGLTCRWSGFMFLVGFTIIICTWPIMEWLVAVLFQRGVFGPKDTAVVAELLRWGMLQLPFYFAIMVATQALYSYQQYGFALIMAAGSLAAKIVLNFLFAHLLGLPGIMLASACMYGLSMLVALLELQRLNRKSSSLDGKMRSDHDPSSL